MGERVPAYKWAKAVRERDGNRCVICGSRERPQAHHVKQSSAYPELSNDVSNGVTLCYWHHYLAHGGYYAKNGNPNRFTPKDLEIINQIEKYLSDIYTEE